MPFPSVTQILSPYSDFSRVPADRLQVAAERGTRVHGICAAIVQGLWVPMIPEECSGYVASFRQWLDTAKPEILMSEQKLSHPTLQFLGHPDLIVRFPKDPSGTVVDFKTPLAKQRTWALQLAAYRELARANGYDVTRAGSLRLKPDGGFPIFDEYRDHGRSWAAFLGALSVWNYLQAE